MTKQQARPAADAAARSPGELRAQLDRDAQAAIAAARAGDEPVPPSVPPPPGTPPTPEGATISPDAMLGPAPDPKPVKVAKGDGKPKAAQVDGRLAHMGMDSWLIVRELAEGYTVADFYQGTLISVAEANRGVAEILASGWVLNSIEVPGYTPQGIRFIYQFIREEYATAEQRASPIHEVLHISKTLTSYGGGGKAITGFDADALLTGYLREGWRVRYTKTLVPDGLGLPFVWFLVR